MDSANVIALVGIVSTATVAITAQVFGHLREAATRRHTERLQQDADKRGVLDAALATAYEARACLQQAADTLINALDTSAVEGGCIPRSTVDELQASQVATSKMNGEIRLAASRLTVRFGPSTILATYLEMGIAYATALTASGSMYARLLADLHAGGMPDGLHDDVAAIDQAVAKFAEAAHAWATRESRSRFPAARSACMTVGQR